MATMDASDAGFVSAYREGDRVWIKKVYVLASLRGLSLGKRLIETAVSAFPGAGSVALLVNDGNAKAIGFYNSQGFAAEASVPVRMGGFDYTDYLMAKPLA
jgi:ribosomal protein S18 acetylase RimI-like enzyme